MSAKAHVAQIHPQVPMRIISHNIRYAATSLVTGEKPWAQRKQLIINQLLYNTVHIPTAFICLQEVLNQQVLDIAAGLGPEWAYIGVGRNDGLKKGEYSPIFYRPSIWNLTAWETVWLSETPNVPSKGWDAANNRIVTVGIFQHYATGEKVLGMSTHFDHVGAVSRKESAKLILSVVEKSLNETLSPCPPRSVFLAGDLNAEMTDAAYLTLNGPASPLQDIKELAPWKYGDRNTSTGFTDSSKKHVIDYVFIGPKPVAGLWKVEGYSVLPNKFEDGVYSSDHRAVVGDVVLKV